MEIIIDRTLGGCKTVLILWGEKLRGKTPGKIRAGNNTMKGSYVLRGLAVALATALTIHQASAQVVSSNRLPVSVTGLAAVAPPPAATPHRAFAALNGTNLLNRTRVQSPGALQKIRLVPGGAHADFGAYKASFAPSLTANRPVRVTTPDNRRLSFRPSYLVYTDTANSNSVLLGVIQNAAGGVQLPGGVIYQHAFTGLDADVQYLCTANSLEQNIILRKQPPTPASLGLNPATTRLEMWTEWFDRPMVGSQTSQIKMRSTNQVPVMASDAALDFGTMKIVRGAAFTLQGRRNSVPVAKAWGDFQGRKFLVETVDYQAIQPALQTLTASASPASRHIYGGPESMIQALAAVAPAGPPVGEMQLARADTSPGVVLDFAVNVAVPLPEGALAWWPAGDDATDVVGSHNGTVQSGSTYTAGVVGQGFAFDGGAGYVSVPDSDDWAFGGDFTIEFWANLADFPSESEGEPYGGVFLSSDAGGGDANKWFFALAGGVLNFHINDPVNGGVFLVNAPFSPSLNTWYHLALTRKANTFTAYVNGVAVGSDQCSRAMPNAYAPLMLGQAEGFYFKGALDEMAIYNRALTVSEINAIYTAGGAGKDNPLCVSPATNAIGWWAGDGDAVDLINTNNGTLYNAVYAAGEVNRAFDLDGSSGYVAVPDSDQWAFGTNNFTIELWANFADYLSGDEGHPYGGGIIASDNGGGNTGKWMFTAADGVIDFHINDPTNGPVFLVNAEFYPDPGAWYHLALTRSNQLFTIYVNGLPVGMDTNSRSVPNAAAPLTIGQAEGFFFYGKLDEITIYRGALGGPEIAAIHAAGGAGKCKSDVDQDGLPDWWEYYWFNNLWHTGLELDANGNTLLDDYQNSRDPNIIKYSIEVANNYVTNSHPDLHLTVTKGDPAFYTVQVNNTNFMAAAYWMAYTSSTITANLGTNEGWHELWVGLKGCATNADITWQYKRLKLDATPPRLFITGPTNGTVDVSLIQVTGYSPEALSSISYDLSNAAGTQTNQQVLVLNQHHDTNTWEFTTNTFQAFDVFLTNGVNTFTFHATDLAGNAATLVTNFTLDYATKTNPPGVQIIWPTNGTEISGSQFTLDGIVADATLSISATITATNGNTRTITGVVERTGKFWVDNLPLESGTNSLSLTVEDAVSHVTTTNFWVVQSAVTLTIDAVADPQQLWQPSVNLTGTISNPNYAVWVNGVKGHNDGAGHWSASNVPVNSGGTASFTVIGYAPNELQPNNTYGNP